MQTKRPDWIRETEGSTGVAIEVTASARDELFARAAKGLFWVLCNPDTVRARETIHVRLDAPDVESLLAGWLSALNDAHATENCLFGQFDVAVLDTETNSTGLRLDATCSGEPIDRSRHTLYSDVHGVQNVSALRCNGTTWSVEIEFEM